ncbi:MAG: hypothetical protein AAGD05_16970, partial [Bacteroidota bacterium]
RVVGSTYWDYASLVSGTTIILTGLNPSTDYEYQVVSGCDYKTSNWSASQTFSTTCLTLNCGYFAQGAWTYGDCTAPICVGDAVRLRLQTIEGTSTWTGPNGYTGVGNANNTIFLNPFPANGYGTYVATHTDPQGCVSTKTIEVVPNHQLGAGYAIDSQWTYGTTTAPVCIADFVRLRLQTIEGTSTWTGPNGYTGVGNASNTIFLNPFPADGYGTYVATYNDGQGCISTKTFEVVPQLDIRCGYFANGSWTYGNCTATVNTGDYVRLRLESIDGTSTWTGPNGYTGVGNANNTIFLNNFSSSQYGTYYATYTDNGGCSAVYRMDVVPQAISLQTGQPPISLRLSPNPIRADQVLNLHWEAPQSGMEIFSIWDIQGKKHRQVTTEVFAGRQTLQFDLSGLAPGLYVLTNLSGKQSKFVITR